MKILLIITTIVIMLSSCSTDIINKFRAVDSIVINSEAYDRVTYVGLSATDLMVLNHARNRYLSIRERWKNVIIDQSFSSQEVSEDYNHLVSQYNAVVNLINKNYSKYSKEDMEYFNQVSKKFIELDNTIDNFYDISNATKVLKELIIIAGAILLR